MKAIQTINNNVAVCIDDNGKELVAFGKGIGYPSMPYKIDDLNKIDMTFYRVDSHYYNLLQEIPEKVFEVSAQIVSKAQKTLKRGLNPNAVFGLADHINFAIVRQRKYANMKMLFSYDVAQLYPEETEIGRYALKIIQEKLFVTLPESEITNIALHFVNAEDYESLNDDEEQYEEMIEKIVETIEKDFVISVDRNEFNFNRFSMHMRYYFQRIKNEEQFMDSCEGLLTPMRNECPEVYVCAKKIASYIDECMNVVSTEDELFYLMIHINRMIYKER